MYDLPVSWSEVVFSGTLPSLQTERFGNQLSLLWPDPGCHFTLERSPQLTPTSWSPLSAPRIESLHDGFFRAVMVDMSLKPREFFRLRR